MNQHVTICVDDSMSGSAEELHPPPDLPTRFDVAIGGYFAPSYHVELEGDTILYHRRERPNDGGEPLEETLRIRPTPARWRRFWRDLDDIGVWRWNPEYPNPPDTQDGTQWGLEITHEDRTVSSSGSNDYPSDDPGTGPPTIRGPFDRFLSAMERLLGGQRFR